MNYIDRDPIAEVRRNRELLLEKYGGIDGLHTHMDEQRPLLEKRGWKFISAKDAFTIEYSQGANGIFKENANGYDTI